MFGQFQKLNNFFLLLQNSYLIKIIQLFNIDDNRFLSNEIEGLILI